MHSLFLLLAIAAEPLPAPETAAAHVPTPYDAVISAAAFIATVPPEDAPFIRFQYVQSADEWRGISIAINDTLSTVGSMVLPQRVNDYLYYLNLRKLARDEARDLPTILANYEDLFDDPYFTEVVETYEEYKEIPVPAYTWHGTRYTSESGIKLRVAARHAGGLLGAGGYKALVEAINTHGEPPTGAGPLDLVWFYTASRAGIVHGRRLIARSQSQVDLGFGKPLYYEWSGFKKKAERQAIASAQQSAVSSQPTADKKAKDKAASASEASVASVEPSGRRADKQSDLDVIFAGIGASIDEDFRAVIMEESNVTEKKRTVLVAQQRKVLAGNGTNRVYVTLDPNNKQVGFDADPFRVVALPRRFPRHTAKEILFEKANGLLASVLTNEQGDLQDAAPPDVVADRETPPNYTTELHAGIVVCLRCHIKQEGRGFRTLTNDLRTLANKRRVVTDDFGRALLKSTRIFDDVGQRSRAEAQNQATEIYDWDPEDVGGVLAGSRIALEQAMIRATGCAKIEDAVAALVTPYNAYIYDRVTPEEAAATIGYRVKGDEATALCGRLLDAAEALTGVTDPTLTILASAKYDADKRSWRQPDGSAGSVTRWQWEAIYATAALAYQDNGRPLEAPPAK